MKFIKTIVMMTLVTLIFVNTTRATEVVHWRPNVQAAIDEAAKTNRLVLIHFWIPGCGPCLALDRNVFSQASFANAVEANFVPVKINASQHRQLAAQYKVNRFPADIVITSAGQVVASSGCPRTTNQYVAHLAQISIGQQQVDNRYLAQRRSANADTRSPQNQNNRLVTNSRTLPQNSNVDNRSAENRMNTQTPPRSQPFDRYANRYNKPQTKVNTQSVNQNQNNRQIASQNNNPGRYNNESLSKQNNGFNSNATKQQPNNDPNRYDQAKRDDRYRGQPNDANNQSNAAGQRNFAQQPNNAAPKKQNIPNRPVVQAKLSPLAIDGYCVMTLHDKSLPAKQRWRPGDRRWGINHQGRLYLFASAQKLEQFKSKPNRYAPVLAGYDPVLWVTQKKPVVGLRKHGLFYDDQIYLFSSEATLQVFEQNPQRFAEVVLQANRPQRQRAAQR